MSRRKQMDICFCCPARSGPGAGKSIPLPHIVNESLALLLRLRVRACRFLLDEAGRAADRLAGRRNCRSFCCSFGGGHVKASLALLLRLRVRACRFLLDEAGRAADRLAGRRNCRSFCCGFCCSFGGGHVKASLALLLRLRVRACQFLLDEAGRAADRLAGRRNCCQFFHSSTPSARLSARVALPAISGVQRTLTDAQKQIWGHWQ